MSSGDLKHSSHCKNIPLARAGLECGLFLGQKLNVLIFARLPTVHIL